MYSGESAMPTIRSRSHLPFITAVDGIADGQPVRGGERLTDQHLAALARLDVSAFPQEKIVEHRRAALGNRDQTARRRFVQARARRV